MDEYRQHTEPSREQQEMRGRNTEVRFTFVRHSQKVSGKIFDKETGKSSSSGISDAGKERANVYGREQLAGRKINKAYATEKDRTKETLNYAFSSAGINPQILQRSESTQAFFAMPDFETSDQFNARYEKISAPVLQKYIDEHFPGKKFDELTPDQQEEAAEFSEESALEWYLSFDDEQPDKETPSPKEQAAAVAFKINRIVNLPDYMPKDGLVDLISSGHKTSTEGFLKYVIEREEGGQTVVGFEKLNQIGGSLKILDSWKLVVRNNNSGKKSVTIVLRRENGDTKNYGLNIRALQNLAQEHIKTNGLKAVKIDFPK